MKDRPVHVDLDSLWRELGVVQDGRVTTFDESAPLASIRPSVTACYKCRPGAGWRSRYSLRLLGPHRPSNPE
jgi:hypothetical protein